MRTLCVLGLLVVAAGAQEEARLGCWRDSEDGTFLVRFEEKRVVVSAGGRLTVLGATYEDGQVVLRTSGRRVRWRTALDAGRLTIASDRWTKTLERLADVPPDLVLAPLPLGEPAELDAGRMDAIRADLAERVRLDQAVRKDPAQRSKMGQVDADNTAYLVGLVGDVGWISAERFGAEASNAAFLIVQHSGDLRLMMAALPEIEKDVRAGRLDPQPYALLYDRLQLNLGGRQRFGTQIGPDGKGGLVVLPLEDRARVEEFRKEIGLFPLSHYLQMFRQQSGGKEVGFGDDGPEDG